MSNAAFKAAFAKVLKKVGADAENVVRETMLDLQSAMIGQSPVDKGTFKRNWQAGIGAIDPTITSTDDAMGRTRAVLQGWKAGQSVWLTNSMPYAQRLEYGWSKQAANGMVRLSVQNLENYMKKAAEAIK